jgi:hypothetical protein
MAFETLRRQDGSDLAIEIRFGCDQRRREDGEA